MAKDELSTVEGKMNLKQEHVARIQAYCRIVRFRGAILYNNDGWETLSSDEFARICYHRLGAGLRQTQIKDLQHYFFTNSEDLTRYANYITMPDGRVWDMDKLKFTDEVYSEDCVYTTAVSPTDGNSHRSWIEEVTLGDKELYADNKKSGRAKGAGGKSRSKKQILAIALAAAGKPKKK